MKYIILIALFLVGCSDDADINRQLFVVKSRLNELETSVLYLQNKQAISEAKYGPNIDANECVMFIKNVDTHAIATVTIPIDGRYYVASFDWENPKINYYKSGEVIPRVQEVFRDTCPQFESLSKRVKK